MFLSGNHDIELCFMAVQTRIRQGLEARSTKGRIDDETVGFRRWFWISEAGVYIEHGSQYDFLNNVAHAMLPVTRGRDRIHPICGKLAFKRFGSRMGYFNPYYEETFFMGMAAHLRHFARYYAFSQNRHSARTWIKGSLSTCLEIARERHIDDQAWIEEGNDLAVRETGSSIDAVRRTHALGEPSGERTMIPILRELWLDRVAWAGILPTVAGMAALLGGKRSAAVALVSAVAMVTAYETLTPKPDLRSYDSAPPRVAHLFDIHRVRAIAMGHTHRPFAQWKDGRFSGNSGTWCPAFTDAECTRPVLDGRPFLWVVADGPNLIADLRWLRGGNVIT